MTDIKAIQKKIIPILKKNNVVKAGLFGSFVRGESKKDSDIDILIKFKGRRSLLDLVKLERMLGENIGKKVDVVEYCTIHPLLKDGILKQEVKIL